MNKAETRAELIDPKLKASGWGIMDSSKILREYHITAYKTFVAFQIAWKLFQNNRLFCLYL